MPNWSLPAYPAQYVPDGPGLARALADATDLAALARYPVVVGLVLTWHDWH
ncbi:hypothetical protein [Cellulomonas fimi]|uniref:Uncharacterized protein n=1 Tax=Cellulomonas fimi TaxID=1708 RepID=A0A7Y0QHE8_CELFI|nr:hypothetical protein [Cellulomonas fimi]NMR19814.1 hypothetical protein [Cellulomonas fimi]